MLSYSESTLTKGCCAEKLLLTPYERTIEEKHKSSNKESKPQPLDGLARALLIFSLVPEKWIKCDLS